MKAAVLRSKGELIVEELPIPQLGKNDVLVKVMACVICGTDFRIYEGDRGYADNAMPIVLGHEFSGIVEAVGKNVSNFKIGDRVCVDPAITCGECGYCKSGLGHFCEKIKVVGLSENGGFAEYCAVSSSQLYSMGDDVSFEEGAMAEPLACCLHGIDLCEIKPGDNVVVFGGGAIGLIMLQLAKLRGARIAALVEPIEERRKVAEKFKADICIDPNNSDVTEELEKFGVSRVNCAIECVGNPQSLSHAISVAGKKSIVMMFGLTKPDESVELFPYELFKKEIVLKASFINPYTMGRAVEMINHHQIDVSSMITKVCSLDELPKIFKDRNLSIKGQYVINPLI